MTAGRRGPYLGQLLLIQAVLDMVRVHSLGCCEYLSFETQSDKQQADRPGCLSACHST